MRYKIYSKDGSVVRCATEKLEYNGTFMGESSVTISVKSNKSIDFQIGDYVLYRGEKFTFENIPTEKKTDHPNANGSVFQYDNIKLNGYDSELQIPFDDFVGTSDTDHSFTAQPDFSFVAATIDDLAQRVQANLDRYYTGDKKWTINVATGATDEDKKNMLITVSNISCWDAICYCKSKYGKNFIRRGRTITLGANGSTKDITFKVGSHKGLYDMTRNVQADQRIVTRLKSYGNTTNMPVRYYNQLTACGKFTVGTIQSTSSQISLTTEFPHSYPETDRLYITNVDSFNASGVIKITLGGVVFDVSVNPNDQRNTIRMAQYIASQSYSGWSTKYVSGTNYVDFVCLTLGKKGVFTFNSNGTQIIADIKVDIEGTDKMYLSGYTAVNDVAKYAVTLMCGGNYVSATISQGISTYNGTTADIMLAGNESSFTAFKAALTVGGTVYISTGANIGYLEEQYTSYISYDVFSDLPNNMNIANLMLPGFPKQTLSEWVEANKSKYAWLQDYISQGYTFSTEKYYPYINSKNITSLGIRPYSQYFTSEDDTHKDIFPSLQYFSDGRDKAVGCTDVDGNAITDSGILKNGDSIEFKIIIKDLGFNFADVQVGSTSPKIHFNTGYCGGRDFTAKSWTKNATTGYWEMRCERVYDSSIGRYFPYKDANILSGDKFVITDIKMPTEYIEQASVELLYWSFKWLVLNDFSIYSYSLSPDTNFIKRHDDAITDKTITFHQTIREGDLLQVDDTDIAVTGAITVDTIKIIEGDGLLPKYDITLRDTKTVGTIQKIQQQIDSLSGNVSSVASIVSSPSGNGLNTDIVKELDTTTLTDANVLSSKRVLKEISDRGHSHENKVQLDKIDQDLSTDADIIHHSISTKGYISGIDGYGGKVDNNGNSELESLKLRSFLEAPEYRFNRVDVIEGELWNAAGFGLIKSVDTTKKIIELKLEDSEMASIAENDLCRGIYNNSNSSSFEVDGNGFPTIYGFFTSYFRIDSIIENSKGRCKFTYTLGTIDGADTTLEPCPMMKFSCFGNSDITKGRSASCYHTRTYTRYLRNVTTFKITQANIAAQEGLLDGLSFMQNDGTVKNLSGYGCYYDNNVYMNGVVMQLDNKTMEQLKGSYSVWLSSYSDSISVNTNGIIQGGLSKMTNGVLSYVLQTAIFAMRGDKYLTVGSADGTAGEYTISIMSNGCTACISNGRVIITSIDGLSATDAAAADLDKAKSIKQCSVDITVNCEGKSIFVKTWTITIEHPEKGDPGIPGEVGPLVYPAGTWVRTSAYTINGNAVPVVDYNGTHYRLISNVSANVSGNTSPDSDTEHWRPFNEFQAVWSKIVMSEFGELASAVFSGDYMISQQGIDATGNASSEYQKFTNENGTEFMPNILINFLTGLFRGKKMEVEGKITANLFYTPFKTLDNNVSPYKLNPNVDGTNIKARTGNPTNIVVLPSAVTWDGLTIRVIFYPYSVTNTSGYKTTYDAKIKSNEGFIYDNSTAFGGSVISSGNTFSGYGLHTFTAVNGFWYIDKVENTSKLTTE